MPPPRQPPRRPVSPPPAAAPSWLPALLCAALAAAVLALYAQTAGFAFVHLDDLHFLIENRPVAAGLTWDGFVWSLTARSPNWHPVTWWTHMVDRAAFGDWAGGHHLVSAVGHALNAVLCFLALRRLTGALWPSALAAALWALHPLRVESVAWLSERKDVMSGLFFMLTLLAYAAYARRPSLGRYLLVAAALALGLASKTMLVTLPLILLLLDVWPLGRLGWPGGAAAPARAAPASLPRLCLEKLPLLLLAGVAALLTLQVQETVSGLRTLDEVSLPWRLVNAPLATLAYLRKSLWPVDLAALYPHPALLAGARLEDWTLPSVGAVFVLAALTAASLAGARRFPYVAVGWLWYLIALAPVIGLVQVGQTAMADRYTYLSTPGLYLALACGLRDLIAWRPRLRRPVLAACALALVAGAALTWRQIGTWRDSESLLAHALAVTRDNVLAEASYGAVLKEDGRFADAEPHLRRAIALSPEQPFPHMHLGVVLQDTGRLAEAEQHHRQALRLSPNYPQALANLGVVLLRQQRLDEAIAAIQAALAQKPDYALAESNLGAAYLHQGRFAEARQHLERAIGLDPGQVPAHNNLGVALYRLGDAAAARAQFARALQLDPANAMAADNLEKLGGAAAP